MLIFFAAALISEVIGTFTGFGATTILLPISTLFMPVKESIVLVGVFHLFGTFFRTLLFVRKVNLKIALTFGIPSLVFSYIGASLLTHIDGHNLTHFVGFALIVFALFNLFKNKLALPKSNILLVSGGSIVGLIAGLIGTAGAMRGAFLTSWGLSSEVYLGTGALMGIGADVTRVFAYHNQKLTSFINTQTLIILILVALFGSVIGRILVLKTNQKLFNKIVFVGLILAGARLLIS